METTNQIKEIAYQGGENFNLRDILLKGKHLSFKDRLNFFEGFYDNLVKTNQSLYMRRVNTPADRSVKIFDPVAKELKDMLMFGSNNYLGLANHPYIRKKAQKAIEKYGIGIGGPPLLNGYTAIHRELEERLAAFKGKESTLIFSTGYGANVGLITALLNRTDTILYDEYSHASFCDGLKMADANSFRFRHNNIDELETLIEQCRKASNGDLFVGVEGIYSMDGDLAPLDKIVELCKKNNSYLIIDDAHGTGVMGRKGRGTAEYFNVEKDVDIIMGTFSKTFGAVGGFVCASKEVIDYLRFFARSYMFSASLPPVVIATVLAGIDLIEKEPELIERLHSNVNYVCKGLGKVGLEVNTPSAIIALRVPKTMNIRKAVYHFHKLGIFVNSIEYPAVPISQQRFRISIMANHTKEDLDRLVSAVEEVWDKFDIKDNVIV